MNAGVGGVDRKKMFEIVIFNLLTALPQLTVRN